MAANYNTMSKFVEQNTKFDKSSVRIPQSSFETQRPSVTTQRVIYGETSRTVGTRVFVNVSTILLIMVVTTAFVLVLISFLQLRSDENQISVIQSNVALIYMNLFSTSPGNKRNIELGTEERINLDDEYNLKT